MMCNYDIDRFCGFCGETIKNAVAENVEFCPHCGRLLRKKRYGRHKDYKRKKKTIGKGSIEVIDKKESKRAGRLVYRVS